MSEEQKPKKKEMGCGCLTIIAVVILLGIVGSLFGGGDKETKTSPPEPTSSQKQASIDWPTAEITEQNIRSALSGEAPANPISKDLKFPENITQISIENHAKEGQKSILIYYKADTAWDETDFVKRVGGTAIVAASILFQNPKIEQLGIFAQADMTDQYGKTSTEVVTKIVLTRDLAQKVDWKGLAERHVTDPGNIYRIADNYNIHLGILNKVKTDEVRLR
ncbi:Uncharacterized [Moorella glycerini]|uniref:Uncharacterized protein n=1 Tax=Neomoorella stamsii TaxID=1266720 RepID=A0A9X7J195_9FIRM|nr:MULTISPECIES: hypothetical protein [Moorella]PRR69643.1 hypothetical protein MOST_30650 [Moorella stamsii]CEP67833.1 Uncharacterized [Moorella glycerini]